MGPRYVSLFLSIVFYDQLAPSTLARGGLLPSVAGAAAGGVLAYLLLFLGPAWWGLRTRRTLTELGTRTFGTAGSRLVLGGLVGLIQVGWFAVAVSYAAMLTLRGLELLEIVPLSELRPRAYGSVTLAGGPVWVFAVLAWSLAAAILGPLLIRIVAALMSVYNLFVAAMLGGLLVWALGSVPRFPDPGATRADQVGAFWSMLQLVFCYGAAGALGAADWGARSRSGSDVRIGGLVGMGLAPLIVVSLALVTVGGAIGRTGEEGGTDPGTEAVLETRGGIPGRLEAPGWTYHEVVLVRGVGGVAGWALLTGLALALLGPVCYAPALFREALATATRRGSRMMWAVFGAALAWPLAMTGQSLRLPLMFQLLGALTVPIVAVIAADAVRSLWGWRGERVGWNGAGLAGWAVGALVAGLPWIAPGLVGEGLSRPYPGAVLGFAAAFLLSMVLAWLGWEAPEAPAGPTAAELEPVRSEPETA